MQTNNERSNRVILDWITLTFFVAPTRDKCVELLCSLGIKRADIVDLPGINLYKDGVGLVDRTIRVNYSPGVPDMGINLVVTGQGCRLLDSLGVDIFRFTGALGCRVNCTRLDIAYDVFDGLFDLQDVRSCLESGHYVSRYRHANFYGSRSLKGKLDLSPTCFRFGVGSKTRIYDKALEQGVDYPWVRVEVEGRDTVASAFLSYLASGITLHQVFSSYLSKNLKFTDKQSNKSNSYNVLSWWEKILDFAEDLSFSLGKVVRSIEQKFDWLKKQVSKTFYEVTDYFMATEIDVPSILFEEGRYKFVYG